MKNDPAFIKIKTGIRRKIIDIACLSILISMALSVSIFYFVGFRIVRDSIGKESHEIAVVLGKQIANSMSGELEDTLTYASRPLYITKTNESNAKYEKLTREELVRFGEAMDKKWRSANKGDPLYDEYIENSLSAALRAILDIRTSVSEIFMTDRNGFIVATSGKTTDFYQADEPWWQKAYADGRGENYIGDVEFDESSGSWGIPMAVPMRDTDGMVIGICKESIAISRIFYHVIDYKIGRTGHALIAESDGLIVYHPGIDLKKERISAYTFKSFNSKGVNYFFAKRGAHAHANELFVAFAEIKSEFLNKHGLHWSVFIDQDAAEAFEPLRNLTSLLFIIALAALIMMWPIGYVLGSIFVRPIKKLRMAVEKVTGGDWDFPISVKTGDEIEEFSDAFRNMVATIKARRQDLFIAKEELERLSRSLAIRVEERTKDLSLAQEATLNILEDLTEAKQHLEKESKNLAEALEIKSSFTSTVSHELRTPLAAIKEGIAIVLDGTAGNLSKEQTDFLVIAKRNVDRLTRLINDVLDFQKLERRGIPFNIALNNINDTVKEVASSMLQFVESKGITLTLELDDDVPKIVFDKDKIVQVLTNLVGNSVNFTDEGSVTIATSRSDNFVQVSVSDTGRGIAAKDMPRLFKQFDQIQPDIKRKVGGTGLGLAICKGIIDAHHGKIWADSVQGKGSVFSFILPIREQKG